MSLARAYSLSKIVVASVHRSGGLKLGTFETAAACSIAMNSGELTLIKGIPSLKKNLPTASVAKSFPDDVNGSRDWHNLSLSSVMLIRT